jgi:hypothetical protein
MPENTWKQYVICVETVCNMRGNSMWKRMETLWKRFGNTWKRYGNVWKRVETVCYMTGNSMLYALIQYVICVETRGNSM